MRFSYIILIIISLWANLACPVNALAQKTPEISIDLSINNKNLKEVLTTIQKKIALQLIYNDKIVSAYTNISITATNKPLFSILDDLFSKTNLHYLVQNDKIIIAENEKKTIQAGVSEKPHELFQIRGTVTDEKGKAVSGATIFLSKTKSSGISTDNGKFNLGSLEPGKYELVINMLGFSLYKQFIFIEDSPLDLNISLKESVIALNPVVVKTGKPDPRKSQYLTLFKDYFIGQSSNAAECQIINPEVLNFRYTKRKDMLEASSNKFVTIENLSLGYRVNYLISKFELYFKSGIIFYQGSPYFEELEGSEEQVKQWKLNRQLAYQGSVMHFFRSVFNNSVESEGFLVYQLPKKKVLKKLNEQSLLKIKPVRIDSIFNPLNNNIKEMNIKLTKRVDGKSVKTSPEKLNIYPYYILYKKEKEPMAFVLSGRHITFPLNKNLSATSQISVIQPLSNKILVDKNGGFQPESFLFKGYWSWEGIADTLPLDYVDALHASCP